MGLIDSVFVPYWITCDAQKILIFLEVSLILGVVWLIFKKNKSHNLNLTLAQEEALIDAYEPESLTDDVPDTHHALKPRIVSGKIGLYIDIDGVKCLNFSSHDYLGFIGSDKIEEKVMKCIETYGVGACGPRGFYGTSLEHLELEKSLAEFMGASDSLIYSYGFATLASAIPAYAKKKDIIFVDEKRNFAIQKGLDASKSVIKFFKHNDTKDLESILEKVKRQDLLDMRKARKSRKYLVVEGIYINSGEICSLPQIVKLCKKYKVRILIDESISLGILGKTGRGVTEYFGIPRDDIDLIMGSLEYVFASVGGFCIGSRFLIDHQQMSGLGYCFSASLPPLLVTAGLEVLRNIQKNPGRLARLNELCSIMHYKLNFSNIINNHFVVSGDPDSPIHLLGLKEKHPNTNAERALEHTLEFCLYKKVAITRAAFLPEDSSMDTPSLRITTGVFHKEEDITYLVKVLEEACKNIFYDYYKDL